MNDELLEWLRANLGSRSLGALTGQDTLALAAAVAILRLYQRTPYDHDHLPDAFAACVRQMQPSTKYLAYHSIAHVMDWPDRRKIWQLAGLPMIENPGRCKFE